ncbi:MAG TPA: TIM barrel protein [Candidatus Sulfotelmatobacter sp.]|jgi:sugar phosphate isomerase/epimerase|nr:TIM barrel protein [Candidatus Sulfotelmatobacter sp.]
MKLAISTLALPSLQHGFLLPVLAQQGFAGIEVRPERTWTAAPSSRDVATYRYAAEEAGLSILGIDVDESIGLLDDDIQPALTRLENLSALCRDLGGRTIALGSFRRLNGLDLTSAWNRCRLFLDALLPRIEAHETVLCLKPLGPERADFCGPARECRLLTDYVDHPSLGLMLSARSQGENADLGHAPFSAVRGRLELFHADEPDDAPLGPDNIGDHGDFRRHLAAISHRGWVVMKQRQDADVLGQIEASAAFFRKSYLRQDNLSLIRRQAHIAMGMGLPT